MRFPILLALALPVTMAISLNVASAQVAAHPKPVRDAGDQLSKPVGMASANTLGSFTAESFVENAARSDMYEIRAGKLAERRSSNPKIKAFAAEMVTAHTKTSMGLKEAIASGKLGIVPPTDLDKRREGLLANLQASSASEFDKRYVAQQIAAHEETLDLMKGYADHGDKDALKAAATKTAPLVAEHLKMAKALPDA